MRDEGRGMKKSQTVFLFIHPSALIPAFHGM
jgi:hypothetical protein